MPNWLVTFARRHHAWVVAAGLLGLAAYHASRGESSAALSAVASAAGLLGLHLYPRQAPPAEVPPPAENEPHEDLTWK